MGLGDELMAAGQARIARMSAGRPVAVVDRSDQQRVHEIFAVCPDVERGATDRHAPRVVNAPEARPYIDYGRTWPGRVRWRWREDFRATPARVELPADLLRWADGYAGRVIVQPHLKRAAAVNKQWGLDRWQELIDRTPGVPWLQIGEPGMARLVGVPFLETPHWRHALAIMARCWAAVLHEGFLHHAAAAFGRPAVVIFGGYISPAVTGYEGHINLFQPLGEPLGCGHRRPCDHCTRAMAMIPPADVAAHLNTILAKEPRPMPETPAPLPSDDPPQGLKQWGGLWLPAGETHLIDWMRAAGQLVDGRHTYQWRKIEAALAFVREWRTAIDVGAHCGLWSMHLAKRFQRLEAFEPVPLYREAFARNVPTDRAAVRLWDCALGNRAGTVEMRCNPISSGDSWVRPESYGTENGTPLRRLDDLDIEGPVDFIKLDTEGFELFALQGGEQLLRRWHPAICVEQKPNRAAKYGLGQKDAVTWLQDLGAVVRREIGGDFYLTWDAAPC